jgi:uncharacterized protein YbaP (TraB family)
MKKIKINFFGLLLIVSTHGFAQEAADTAFEKTVFWQISGNGLKDTSYLFGTSHPIFREDIHIAGNMLEALLKAKAVFFENIPVENYDSLFRAMNIMNKPRLRRLLGSISYNLLTDILKKYNDTIINDPLFLWMTPQYLNSRVMWDVFGSRLTTFDNILMAIAVGNDQPIFALDRKEVRAEVMEMNSLDQQANNLYRFIEDIDKSTAAFKKRIKDFTALYYTGNIGYMYTRNIYRRINNQLNGMQIVRVSIADDLLDKRNKSWIPVMEASMKIQLSFFAAGVVHLAGRNGLINLLRKKGYTVSPIFLQYK